MVKSEEELREAISITNRFGQLSGTKLNTSKCEGLWLGRSKYKQVDCKLEGVKWPQKPIRFLGIYIGHNAEENKLLNWTKKLDVIVLLYDHDHLRWI